MHVASCHSMKLSRSSGNRQIALIQLLQCGNICMFSFLFLIKRNFANLATTNVIYSLKLLEFENVVLVVFFFLLEFLTSIHFEYDLEYYYV